MWSLVDIFYPGETARAEELSKKNRDLNQRKVEAGQISQEWSNRQQERFDATGPWGEDPWNEQMIGAAKEGAVEGLQSLPDKFTGALNSAAGWSLGFVPWWGWIIAGGLVWGYLGGWVYLRGILARKT